MRLKKTNAFIILNIVFMICTGLIKNRYILDAFYVSLVPVLFATLILWKKEINVDIHSKKISIIVSFVLALAFLVMLSIEQAARMLVQMDNEPIHLVFKVLFIPVVFLDSFICIYYLFSKSTFSDDSRKKIEEESNHVSKDFMFCRLYRPSWIIIVVAIIFLVAYFPGDPCSDVPASIIKKNHVFSDWHTLGWEYFMRLFVYSTKNWTSLVVAQSLFLILAHNYVIGYLYDRFESKKICNIYAVLNVTLGIMQFRYMVNMTKDINFLFSMMFFSVSVMRLLGNERSTVKDVVILGISGTMASFFRHMSLEIVIVTILIVIIALIIEKKADRENSLNQTGKQKLVKTTIVSLLCIIIVNSILIRGLGFGILKAQHNPDYVKYSIPMNVVGAMAYRNQVAGEYIPESIVKEMEKIMPIEKWSDCYCSFDADVISRTWNKVGDDILKLNEKEMQNTLLGLNWYFLTRNPKSYIISFFDINSIVWEMATPADEELYYAISEDRTDILHLYKGAAFYAIEDWVEYVSNRPILSAFILRGGIATFTILMALFLLIIKKSKVTVGMIPIVLYDLSLFVSIPQSNSRYSMPLIVFSILFIIVAVFEKDSVES